MAARPGLPCVESYGRHQGEFSSYRRSLCADESLQCIKFKTRSSLFLNRFDSFTRALLAQQQNRPPAPVAVSVLPTPSTAAIPAVAASETPEPPSGKKKKANKKKR